MKNTVCVVIGMMFSLSAQASNCSDFMKARTAPLKRGELVGELVVQNGFTAKAGETEMSFSNLKSGVITTVRFREKLSKDLVIDKNAFVRLYAVSDRSDNQDHFLNCEKGAGTCLHVDHPQIDTVSFTSDVVSAKDLRQVGLSVCQL